MALLSSWAPTCRQAGRAGRQAEGPQVNERTHAWRARKGGQLGRRACGQPSRPAGRRQGCHTPQSKANQPATHRPPRGKQSHLQHLQQLRAKGCLEAALNAHLHGGSTGGTGATGALQAVQCSGTNGGSGRLGCSRLRSGSSMSQGQQDQPRQARKVHARLVLSCNTHPTHPPTHPTHRHAPAAEGTPGHPPPPQHQRCRRRQSGKAARHPGLHPLTPQSSQGTAGGGRGEAQE